MLLLGSALQSAVTEDACRPDVAADDAFALNEVRLNVAEHERDSEEICSNYFCGPVKTATPVETDVYELGMKSVDCAKDIESSNALIHVTKKPLFTAAEMDEVIAMAEREGVSHLHDPAQKERADLKYGEQVAIGKSVKSLPGVLRWFNKACEEVLWPQMAALFPSLITDGSQLRAHGIVVLKYNSSQPRTDVHVDPALFAFTIALSQRANYEGGGTYFEHVGATVEMEQGHVTFRPGAVRHAGAAITGGLRYVIGGFIAVQDRVEHIRRLNARGAEYVGKATAQGGDGALGLIDHAVSLFKLGTRLNAECALCSANLGDAYLRVDKNVEAEAALRRQVELVPADDDAHYALGMALRSQDRDAEAAAAYQSALAIEPKNFLCHSFLAGSMGALGRYADEKHHYLEAIRLRPSDVKTYLNLGISHSSLDEAEEAEAAFRRASVVGPTDANPPLNLARFLAKMYRPAEAIHGFYRAAALNSEVFDEVKAGVGTARAQQGRLGEAVTNFESAARMSPSNKKLQDSLAAMAVNAERLAQSQARLANAVDDICGTPCQDVVDQGSISMCDLTWQDGCGDVPPPEGFAASATVAQLCAHTCAYSTMAREA